MWEKEHIRRFTDVTAAMAVEYLSAIVEGDHGGARRAVDGALLAGAPAMAVYLEVLVPCQRRVGDLWMRGDLSVAGEHLATEITSGEMEYLRSRTSRKFALGKHAVVAAAPNERHTLGARIVADFLFVDGWDVDFLGADVPAQELAAFAADRNPDVVALSVVLPENLGGAQEGIAAAKNAAGNVPVLLGGPAIRDALHARQLGADGFAADASQALEIARRLAGIDPAETLGQILKGLDSRIQTTRRSMNWSQQDLAEASGLDRTYVSALENGRQNLTIGALVRIAMALGVPAGELLGH